MQRRSVLSIAAGLGAIALAPGAFAQGAAPAARPRRIRGTIDSLQGDKLMVTTNAGEKLTVVLAPNYTVGAVVPTTLDKVKPGSMIGIVGFGPPKQQRAAVISIFPPGANVADAQFPWDSQPESTMTNAPVTSEVASADGRVLTVTVKGEPIQVTVPQNAIIQTTEPGTPAMIVPGAKVIIFAQESGGVITAPRVSVGKDGFTPAN